MTIETFEREEQELLESYEQDEWQSIDRLDEEILYYQAYATAVAARERLVSITLPVDDFEQIQKQASASGVSYQTWIADIIHRFVGGNLVEQQK